MARKSYSEEFRRQAVDLYESTPGATVRSIAREGQQAGWFAAQDALVKLSTNSAHRSVTGATHEALLYDEGYSVNSSRAILDVVAALRAGAPLQP
jgi:hypothetical protein